MPDRIVPARPPAVADMMLPVLSYEIVARADMLDETGRIAAPELAGGNILEHHGARGDDAVIPDRHARQDRGVAPDPEIAADADRPGPGGMPFMHGMEAGVVQAGMIPDPAEGAENRKSTSQ